MRKIGVGVIGAGLGGWAALGHVPALAALPEYELRAVSTSREESARAAARQFGVPAAYGHHAGLISDPGVDLVVVAVKVTHHRELVEAALEAGKMVYGEWPLGNGLDEAAGLARRARAAGVRTVIGLQARFAPQVRYARDLIEQGYLGRVMATTLVGSGLAWGPVTDRSHAYWYDDANGATTLTVPTLHALEAVHHVLGEFAAVSANLVNGRTGAVVAEDGSVIPVTAPDQVSLIGTLHGGAAASVHYRGGLSRGDNLRWEINGTEGDLVLTSSQGNLQVADLVLEGGRADDDGVAGLDVPAGYHADLPVPVTGPAHNVAQLYARFARDLRDGTGVVPGFDHALTRHRLIDAIHRSAADGSRQVVA